MFGKSTGPIDSPNMKQEGTRRMKLSRTGRQKGGMFGESTGPVDSVRNDASLCGCHTDHTVAAEKMHGTGHSGTKRGGAPVWLARFATKEIWWEACQCVG
jgi:hypothetical protein